MAKACFLLDHFWGERSGGAEWQTFVLCRALAEAGWEVHYIAESLTGKIGVTQETNGIRVHWLPPLQWRSRIHPAQRHTYRQVRDILDNIQPDVFYCRGNNCFTGIGVCHRYRRERGAKYIWGAAAEWEISSNFYRQRLGYYQKALWRKSLLWLDACIKDWDHKTDIVEADRVVVQTEVQCQMVKEQFSKESVVLPSSHEVPKEPIEKVEPPMVIFVAHIGRRKRAELFVELARRCQDIASMFVVVGDFTDANYEAEVRRQANGLSNVRFVGAVPTDEANRLIAQASLLVSTTDPGREGYPNVFIQAWMRKSPVASLAHDPDGVIAGHPFLGILGITMEGLVEGSRRLLSDPSQLRAMGESAREWAIRRHGCESNRDQIVAIFKEVANSGSL